MIKITVPASLPKLIRELTTMSVSNSCKSVMYKWSQRVRTKALRITPIDTGALRGSIGVDVYEKGAMSFATFYAGGAAAPYAEIVHEFEELHHAHPTQWKYLEHPIVASLDELERDIQEAIAKEMNLL